MSYCVNCGVELDDSAEKCVLCDTPVLNPNKPQSDKKVSEAPFSEVAHIPKEMKSRFIAGIISVVMLISGIVCFIVNMLLYNETLWSVYVLATELLLWVVFVLPFFLKNHRTYIMWAFDTLAVSLYVYLFYIMGTELHKWYTQCALPIILFVSGLILIYIVWVRRKKRHSILKALIICLDIALAFLFSGPVLSMSGTMKYATEIGVVVFLCIIAVVGFLTYCYKSKNMRRWLSERLFT